MASSSQYADAYKLKPDVLDKRKARLQRRSVEWKNLRFEEVGKRRKIDLDNLSPLQEQDQNVTNVSKSYENKTPVKPTSEKSEKKSKADLLKQRLIQWKLEKEQKKKLDAQEKAKKKQFKVSCSIQRTDKNLFRKDKTTSTTTNIKPKDKSSSVKSKNSSITSSRTEASVSAPLTKQEAVPTTRRSTRSNNDANNKNKTVTAKQTKHIPAQPAPAQLVRTARQTRSSAKLKSSPKASTLNRQTFASSQKKVTSDVPPTRTTRGKKLSPQFNIDLAKVSTDRGESFAPSDFAFEAPENVKSFTFKPLSPASAISFLDPQRDLTSTSFFLEPPSGRCSTPKSSKEEDRASSQDTDEGETQQKTMVVHSSSSASESDEGSTTTVKKTPRRQTRSRSSKSSTADSDSDGKQDVTAVQMTPLAESTQQDKPVEMEVAEPSSVAAPPTTPRRSRRASVSRNAVQVDAKQMSDTTADEVASPRKSRRMSVRKQDKEDAQADTKVTEDENQMPVKATRRRSVRNLSDSDSAIESGDAGEKKGTPQKTKTPRGSRRSRRTSSETSIMEKIPEQGSSMDVIKEEHVTDSDDVFTVTVTDAAKSAPDSANQGESSSDSQPSKEVQEVSETSKSTPARTRRCSLSDAGCFREPGLPMSAQKSGRKRRRTEASATPVEARSPEEWVKILSTSPMIEMRRRTPKAPRLSEDSLYQPLNFDDVLDMPPMENGPSTSCVMETDEPVSSGTDSQAGTAKEPEAERPASEKPSTTEESESPASAAAPVEAGKDEGAGGEHDVLYFRNLLTSETARLNQYIMQWNKTKEEEAANIAEEVEGQIRTTVGQAQLLIDQRFKQFRGLVDNCEFKTGEKETTCTDLQGFWDMIYFQVEDVDKKFNDLKTLQANNWQEVKKAVPVKKVVKKKSSAPLKPKAGGPSKFAAFRAQMKKQKEEEAKSSAAAAASPAESVKVIDFGFFTVTSPVKSPAKHCEAGSPAKEKTPEDSTTKPASSLVATTIITKTPGRKSYVPAVPSPLLCDITPKPKPRRSLVTPLKKEDPSVPLSPMGVFTPPHAASPVPADTNATPKRRSIRLRKSLSLTPVSDQPMVSEETPGLDPRFLQPSGQPESDPHNTSDLSMFLEQTTTQPDDTDSHDSSFSKFFQPSQRSTQREGKRSALKKLPSTQRRRSRRSVQFAMSPGSSPVSNTKLPSTPYNRDTLVPRSRLSHGEYLFTPPREETESSADSTPTQKGRPRPSLLFTPASQDSVAVSGDNLMVFTP